MPVPTCNHLKEDGVYCGSPALKGRKYCYFHLNLRGRRTAAAQARRRGHNPSLNLPFPEDMHAVQVCLAEIMWAVAEDRIDTKRAWAILNSLQQASFGLIHTPNWEGEREAVRDRQPLRALNDPNFEKRHGLSPDIDLDADPLSACHPKQSAGDAPRNVSAEVSLETGNSKLETGLGISNLEADSSPDRIPLPEDEVRQFGMTEVEKIEFFVHKCKYDTLTDEQEHALLVQFLRDKRKQDAEDPAFAEERRQFSKEIAELYARNHNAEQNENEAA